MSSVDALGRIINPVPIAAGTKIALREGAGVTFLCTGDDEFTLNYTTTYNGSLTPMATIDHYWTNTETNGSAQWAYTAPFSPAVSAVTIDGGALVFDVSNSDVPVQGGHAWVAVTVGGSGLVAAIVHDLIVQRAAQNLFPLSGSGS